jgi:hypothetical protein
VKDEVEHENEQAPSLLSFEPAECFIGLFLESRRSLSYRHFGVLQNARILSSPNFKILHAALRACLRTQTKTAPEIQSTDEAHLSRSL